VREPPTDLSLEILRARVSTDYGLAIDGLEFLPLGHDSSAWVYRATSAQGDYFVKVRRALLNLAGLAVPRFLVESGVERVVAPLPTIDGRLSTASGRYVVIVYPYVSSMTGLRHGMSDEQWREYGRALRQVHETSPTAPVTSLLRADAFEPDGAAALRRIDEYASGRDFDEAGRVASARLWGEKRSDIRALVERAEELGRQIAAFELPPVLCHADIHTNNVLVAGNRDIWIVDWDETMLAPRERDLMFIVGGISNEFVDTRREALFFEGYGAVQVNRAALAYYRYSWAVSDIASYGEQVFLRSDLGEADQREAAGRLSSLFEPGEIVQIAFESAF
jgi:spectinomycin phosphotransferase